METFFRQAQVEFLAAITSLKQLDTWLQDHRNEHGLAMVGRSNVGKSSLINTMFGKKTAKVSNTPGRTQSINVFKFQESPESPVYYLYDLPGYGHAEVSKKMRKEWDLLLGCFFENLPPQVLLLNIQDARHPFQKNDQEFLSWLMNFPQVSCYLCLNKYDKLKKQKDRAGLETILKTQIMQYPQYKLIFKVSAETQAGLAPLHQAITQFLEKENLA